MRYANGVAEKGRFPLQPCPRPARAPLPTCVAAAPLARTIPRLSAAPRLCRIFASLLSHIYQGFALVGIQPYGVGLSFWILRKLRNSQACHQERYLRPIVRKVPFMCASAFFCCAGSMGIYCNKRRRRLPLTMDAFSNASLMRFATRAQCDIRLASSYSRLGVMEGVSAGAGAPLFWFGREWILVLLGWRVVRG